MKLRVKYKTIRKTIDVGSADATLRHVRDKVTQHISPQASVWFLSLNGVDEISPCDEDTVQVIGLVTGDLIHVVERNDHQAEGHDLEEQLINMGFLKGNVEKVVRSFGAKSLNDALELLNMLDNSGARNTNLTDNKPEGMETETHKKNPLQSTMDRSNASCTEKLSSSVVDSINTPNVLDTSEMKSLFLSDGLTDSFTNLVNRVKCETKWDYLLLAIHSLMLETGLRCMTSTDKKTAGNEGYKQGHQTAAGLPDDWRNASVGIYRIEYVYKSHDSVKCCLTATVTGNSIVVTGTLDCDNSDVVYQAKLNVADYVNISELESGDPSKIIKNTSKLSHKLKEYIANKLLDEIRIKLGLVYEVIGLQSLPDELKLRAVCYLPVQSVCRLSQTSRQWNDLCQDEEVWKRLVYREFRGTNVTGNTYKEVFKFMHQIRKEEKLREQRDHPRTPLRPEFEVSPDILYPARQPVVPGIIGGNYDLYPTGPYQPGGFPIVPGFSPGSSHPDILRDRQPTNLRRPPPGARFDPYGPIPDDDDFHLPRRPQHPDTLRRPGFDPSSGFGGGGFL